MGKITKTGNMGILSLIFSCLGLLSYLAHFLGIYAVLRYLKRKEAIILMYHGISKDDIISLENFDGKHVNRDLFEKQLIYLKKRYSIISMDEYVNTRENKGNLPKNPIVITFDDGYKNNYTVLQSIIKKYNVPVTIFLTADYMQKKGIIWQNAVACCIANTKKESINLYANGRKYTYSMASYKSRLSSLIIIKDILRKMKRTEMQLVMKKLIGDAEVNVRKQDDELYFMSVEEIKKLKENLGKLVSFGSHTITHPDMVKLSKEDAKKEISGSKRIIEKRVGMDVRHFSYPYGAYNQQILDMAKRSGYLSAVSVEHGYNKKNADLFKLKRVPVSNNNNMGMFMLNLFVDLGMVVERVINICLNLKTHFRQI